MTKPVRTAKGGYYSNMKSRRYWRQRSKERLAESFAEAEQAADYLEGVYKDALLGVIKDFKKLAEPYADKDGNVDAEAFKRAITSDRTLAGKYARLQSQIVGFAQRMNKEEKKKVEATLMAGYKRQLLATIDDAGVNVAVNLINDSAIRRAVYTPFTKDGREFSDRIWDNLQDMQANLRRELAQSIARGDSIPKTTRRFREIMGNSAYNTRRLIRTETLSCYANASIEGYKLSGLEFYEVLGDSDDEPCSEFIGQTLEVEACVIGVNAPPFHPNCRCCIAPVVK